MVPVCYRLSEQAQKQLERGSKFENLNLGDSRPSQLIRRYGNLYSQTRLDAYDALDELPEMAEFDDLKGKLLFSVIVVSIFHECTPEKPPDTCERLLTF